MRWLCQRLIDFSCGRLGSSPILTPAHYGRNYLDVQFSSRDGTTLGGWLLPAEQPKGVVLLCHGIYSTRASLLSKAVWCNQWGYACLLFDFRGRGASSGLGSSLGVNETDDVQAAVDFIKQRPELASLPLAAIGESLGAASLVLSRAADGRIDALFLEACFASLEAAIDRRCRWMAGPWAKSVKIWAVANVEARLNYPVKNLAPVEVIAEIAKPTFIVHDQLDWGVGRQASLALYANAKGPKEFWEAPWSLHVQAARMAGNTYRTKLREFLGQHLLDYYSHQGPKRHKY